MTGNREKALRHLQLGAVYQSHGNMRGAEDEYRKAAQLAPDDHMAHYALGICYALRKRFREAASALGKAAQLAPDNVEILLALAHALKEERQWARAAEVFERVITQGRTDQEIYRLMGQCYFSADDFDGARRAYEKLIRTDPRGWEGYEKLGAALVMQKRWAEAAPHLEKAISLGSTNPKRYDMLGLVYIELRDPARGAEALRRAVQIEPENASLYLRLADALRGTFRFDEAKGHTRRALELNPREAGAADMLDTIEKEAAAVGAARRQDARRIIEQAKHSKGAPLVIGLDRWYVETFDTKTMIDTLGQLLADAETVRAFRGRVAINLTGFEGETREPDKIPQVRHYVRTVSESFPYWHWFALTEVPFLKFLLYCLCETRLSEEVGGRRGAEYVRGKVGSDELERFMTWQAGALEELQRRFGLSAREVRRRLKEVNKYYRKALR
jgi:tetratricopeptide (TPR) repeat protein